MVKLLASAFLAGCAVAAAAPESDLVKQVPGFPEPAPYKLYSGYLDVPGPINGYDSLRIHYEFHESLNDPSKDPIVAWHQGGPGGSSLYGQYGEMGYYQASLDANNSLVLTTNPEFSWNTVANMLYLEAPAGSDDPIGFSQCIVDGEQPASCKWNDVTQGEAYAHTLRAFYKAFPAYDSHDLYLAGESYAGQYLPNIANFIVNNQTFSDELNLKGLLVGNGCWGGDATNVNCNGPNADQNDLDMFFGKGMVSKIAYDKAYADCKFPSTSGVECAIALEAASKEVGPHNIYNVYDNCPSSEQWFAHSGKSMRWLRNYLRDQMSSGRSYSDYSAELKELGGGYDWTCGGLPAMQQFFEQDDVRTAMHLEEPTKSRFDYSASGPASITLYPDLVKHLRILIYNGDADACVPYKGNEQWVEELASQGVVESKKAWHPWYAEDVSYMPAGYATTYTVPNATHDFQFVTIRLAGHMVPAFQPRSAHTFFKTFLAGDEL